jgi:hypothetical protein
LGIKPEARLCLVAAPEHFSALLGELPEGVAVPAPQPGAAGVLAGLLVSRDEADPRLPALIAALDQAGGLWIAWPKRSSGVATDVTENVVRELGLAAGLVDNKICAIDETWSGLRLVYRLRDRKPG